VETYPDAGAHRKLLIGLIARLEDGELKFYESSSTFNFFAWHVCAGAAFVMSILSGALASFMSDATFKDYGKVVLAVLSFVSASATGLLSLYKFREKEALREEGRIELEDMIDNAKSLLASATTESECKAAFHQVRERFRVFSLGQHRRDIALRSDEIPKADNGAGR
jgi:hypothetical protein